MATPIPIIIHFVGLALFTSQVPNDCGLKAILPDVFYTAPKVVKTAQKGTAATHISPAHVENHQAVLVFPTKSYISSPGWGKPIPLPKTKGQTVAYEYIKLDGDRVRFDGGIDNQAPDFDQPQLPPLGALCSATTTLDRKFQPPYNGAAAVFDLPQGTVKGCNATTRIDTEVKLSGNGDFSVSASTMRLKKELRLKPLGGKVELIVANIPVSCLKNGVCSPKSPAAVDGMSHVNAYYGMVSQTASCNKTIGDWIAVVGNVPTNTCQVSLP
ncbi:MAG: hypothetical protein ACRD3J_18315, partial [Thermoanaerobaculia bacterium]